MTTPIARLSKNDRYEADAAIATLVASLNGGDWIYGAPEKLTVKDGAARLNIVDEDGERGYCGLYLFRNGEEVVAVPDFYLGEDDVHFTGSKGGAYVLSGDTLMAA